MVACPICHHPGRRLLVAHGIDVLVCDHCSHQFADVSPSESHLADHFGDHYFVSGGVGYPDYLADGALRVRQGRTYAGIVDAIMQTKDQAAPRRLLDVGCAAGFIMAGFASQGWQVHGLEPNASMAAHAREQFGFTVTEGAIDDAAEGFELAGQAAAFDLVVAIQLVAHLRDPQAGFRAMARLLRPGGLLLVETWNSASRTARWLGPSWHEYSPPNVLHYFTPRSLDALAADYGLTPVSSGRPSKRISAAHARSLLAHKYGTRGLGGLLTRALAAIPGNPTLPYPAEDLFWRLYRSAP